jgi:hypothetical protein
MKNGRPGFERTHSTSDEAWAMGRRFLMAVKRVGFDRVAFKLSIQPSTLRSMCTGRVEPTPKQLQQLHELSGVAPVWILHGIHGSLPVVQDEPRPRTRADCVDGPRPCPWVGCRMHLFLHVTDGGRITYHSDDLESMTETCALDVADQGARDDVEIAGLLNMSATRVGTLLKRALLHCGNAEVLR